MAEKFIDPEQTIADLRAAVEVLKANPWNQGQDYNRHTGCLCAFGAIRVAIGGLVLPVNTGSRARAMDFVTSATRADEVAKAASMRDRASNVARAFRRVMDHEITSYNDVEGRTKDQVIRALETVIHSLEADPSRA